MSHTLAPWLSVPDGPRAVGFYVAAFGAEIVYRMEDPEGGLVARLSVEGAEFWVSGGPAGALGAPPLGGDTVRMILNAPDPDALFARAIGAGAPRVFPVGEAHGWRLGRLSDPFG